MPSAILLKRIIDGSRDTAARAIVAARDAADAKGAEEGAQKSAAAENTTDQTSGGPGHHDRGEKEVYLASFMEWRNKQPKRSGNGEFFVRSENHRSGGPGHHHRDPYGGVDPDRAARGAVVDWTVAKETREDFVEFIEYFGKRAGTTRPTCFSITLTAAAWRSPCPPNSPARRPP